MVRGIRKESRALIWTVGEGWLRYLPDFEMQ